MAVELPTEFVVLHRPVSPVDVLAIVERRLVALVNKECVLEGVVCPFLLFFVDFHFFDVSDFRSAYPFPTAVVFEKVRSRSRIVSPLVRSPDFFKSRTRQIQQIKNLCTKFLCPEIPAKEENSQSNHYFIDSHHIIIYKTIINTKQSFNGYSRFHQTIQRSRPPFIRPYNV